LKLLRYDYWWNNWLRWFSLSLIWIIIHSCWIMLLRQIFRLLIVCNKLWWIFIRYDRCFRICSTVLIRNLLIFNNIRLFVNLFLLSFICLDVLTLLLGWILRDVFFLGNAFSFLRLFKILRVCFRTLAIYICLKGIKVFLFRDWDLIILIWLVWR